LEALLEGASVEEGARRSRVSARTVWRWKAEPTFLVARRAGEDVWRA
jgi:hypothetical protein